MTAMKLKRCPFCGGEAEIVNDPTRMRLHIRCGYCGARMGTLVSEPLAIEMWNRRARPEEQDTWVRIDRDLTAHAVAYLLERGLMSEDEVREFDAAEREEAVRRDLVRRAKELAGKEAADE